MKASTVKTEGFTNRTLQTMKEGLQFGNPDNPECFKSCQVWNILITMMSGTTTSIRNMCARCKKFNIER